TFPAFVQSGRPVFGYKEQAYWLDVGTPAALFKGSRDLVSGEFLLMPGAVVAESARVIGGSAIGANTVIEAGARINDCIIGDNVSIGEGAKLSHCFVAHGTKIAAATEKESIYLSPSAEIPITL
ncbi:MAG: NDP-sugar synthase, partial [Actinobacteria bacterium]|nr:NDP-sugar synthase [Actinomycetota bacterium]